MRSSLRQVFTAGAVLALAATVPAAMPAAAAPAPFTTCAPQGAHFHVTSVDITPQPLVPGKKVSISASGTLHEQLTGGTYQAEVRYMGVSVLQRSGSVGELITLPAQAGPATLREKLKVPREAPAGSYELQFSAVDQNNATLTCLVVPFRVG